MFKTYEKTVVALLFILAAANVEAKPISNSRARDLGIKVGTLTPGPLNAITDVRGVLVGHKTIVRGENVRTGVTAVLPHAGNIFQEKVPAAVFVGNGFGKLAGVTQVEELGNIETPIVLTNTLSVGTAVKAVVKYTLRGSGNEEVHSVNAIVGETNDYYLNDIRSLPVSEEDVFESIESAKGGPVEEGAVGAGAGTICFGFKGGIGTSSRVVTGPGNKEYTVGVLVQTNYGGSLIINGAPVGRELAGQGILGMEGEKGGSCMVVIATDAPLTPRNLKRLAKRALHGLAITGSWMSNGSGDYIISFSTAYQIPYGKKELISLPPLLTNESMTPFFQAVIEATSEAVYNSLFMAKTAKGYRGRVVRALPIRKVLEICSRYNVLESQ